MIKPVIALFLAFQLVADAQVVCPLDVERCSDGSDVDRDPENDCNFRECPQKGIKEDGNVDEDEEDNIFCSKEMYDCPDGTRVDRDNKKGCDFKACPSKDDKNDSTINDKNPAPITPAPETPAIEVIFTDDFTDGSGRFHGGRSTIDNGCLVIKGRSQGPKSSYMKVSIYSEVQFSFDYKTKDHTNKLKVGYELAGESWTYTKFTPTKGGVTENGIIVIPNNSGRIRFRFKGVSKNKADKWFIDNVNVTGTLK